MCRILELWIGHFFRVDVKVRSIPAIEEAQWAWHIGLDVESTALLNDLWRNVSVDPGRLRRLIALYRLDFSDPADMRQDVAGRPVYLGLAIDESGCVRMKPQNLLTNLPLALLENR
jgi:hypothetical protein